MILYNSQIAHGGSFDKNMNMKSIAIMLSLLWTAIVSHAQINSTQNKTIMENKTTIQHFYEEVLNDHNLASVSDFVSSDFTDAEGQKGVAAFTAGIQELVKAFPDIHYTLAGLTAEDDRVAVSWTWTGTHKEQFRKYAATGKHITSTGMAIFTLKDGKITGINLQTDRLGFLEALGVIPQP